MSTQIQLAWSVDASDTTFSPAQAAAALGAVVLYQDAVTDPLLGQALGLTVDSDVTATTTSGAKRTLTLDMTSPPPFPCHPTTQTPPVLPYELKRTVSLPGVFTAAPGSATVKTSDSQKPSLVGGDTIQFSSQLGVDYTVLSVGSGSITLTSTYGGNFANTAAFKVLPAPSTLPAIYSSSSLDAVGKSGAHTVSISYTDSLGASNTVSVTLSGKRPTPVVLAGGTIDVAVITAMSIASAGAFTNSVGEITLVDLSKPILSNDTDDQAQIKIAHALAYMPPSYFAIAQQSASQPQLDGDFQVNPNSLDVVPSVDQTGVLSPGDTLQFASQPGVDYTIDVVNPSLIRLTAKYDGFVPATTGATNTTSASASPPTATQLKTPLAGYRTTGNVSQTGAMTPSPTLLSDIFTQTIALALAVPVTQLGIVLL